VPCSLRSKAAPALSVASTWYATKLRSTVRSSLGSGYGVRPRRVCGPGSWTGIRRYGGRRVGVVCAQAPETTAPETAEPELQRKVSPAPGPSFWDWADGLEAETEEKPLNIKFESETIDESLSLRFQSETEVRETPSDEREGLAAEVEAQTVGEVAQDTEEAAVLDQTESLPLQRPEEAESSSENRIAASASSVSQDVSRLTANLKQSRMTLEELTREHERGETTENDKLIVEEEDSHNAEVQLNIASKGDGFEQWVDEEGTKFRRESGEVELDDGKLVRWTAVKARSADGELAWQEKWWETSDAWGYRELGAEKSGRGSNGSEWSHWYVSLPSLTARAWLMEPCLQVG